jgi:hypothetical protein
MVDCDYFIMFIKSKTIILFMNLFNIEIPYYPNNIHQIPYESLYIKDTNKNKNTIEYNTMTMEELIRSNNEKLSTSVE